MEEIALLKELSMLEEKRKIAQKQLEFYLTTFNRELTMLNNMKKRILKGIIDNEFNASDDVFQKLYAKKGCMVNISIYSKDTNKVLNIFNNQILNLVLDGQNSAVRIGKKEIPICGNYCLEEVKLSENGQTIFKNPYYNQNYNIQRAYVFGTDEIIEKLKKRQKTVENIKASFAEPLYKEINELDKKIDNINEIVSFYSNKYPQKLEADKSTKTSKVEKAPSNDAKQSQLGDFL